jgi:two-component system NtrC family sensor kinase
MSETVASEPGTTAGDAVWSAPRSVEIDSETDALDARPRFSVRNLVTSGFALCFFLALAVNILWIVTAFRVQEKLHFLEIADTYLFEIQQARRYEKNFLLYRTGLDDALEHMRVAHRLLMANSEQLRSVIGEQRFQTMRPRSERYLELLEDLAAMWKAERASRGTVSAAEEEIRDKGAELREEGSLVVQFATDLVAGERRAVHAMLRWSRTFPIYFLIALLGVIVVVSHLFARRIVRPLDRFVGYTGRIAAGDFTPIVPARRYRDEFTDLAIALNRMAKALLEHETILVESHKLRALGTLTAGVAHELNNPVNNILLTAQILKEDSAVLSEDERMEMFDDVVDQAERCERIISSLLDFARESESKTEALDLDVLVEETVKLAHNQVRLSGVRLEVEIQPNLPRIHGDRKQLVQVFLNLLLNALQATPKDGRIELAANVDSDSKFVCVSVRDTGTGIPPHLLTSIFDPFFTTKNHHDGATGTGLGLSVSQGIVGRHGGNITVSSTVGAGSTFTVHLPVTTIPARL